MLEYVPDIIGAIGVVLVVAMYFLITSRRITGDDMRFHLGNFIGAWMIMFSLLFNWNTASVMIETVWILISGYGILRCWRVKRQTKG